MIKTVDVRLMVKVARLYYLEGLTQEEISSRYQTSRSTVSRMLKQARDAGILTINIHEPEEASYTALEDALEHTYGLQEALVVEPGETREATRTHLGRVAADYLMRAVRPGDIIGVSWGRTLREVVHAVQPQPRGPLTVIPLVGGSGRTDPEIHANQLAIGLARALGGDWYPLHAPALASTAELRSALMDDEEIRSVLELGTRARIALVGIASVTAESTMYQTGYLGHTDHATLEACGAVGDMNSFFFDAQGRPCAPEVCGRVVGLNLDQLRRTPLTIAVAGGVEKASGVAGALAGGYIKVLVTDADLAACLLRR